MHRPHIPLFLPLLSLFMFLGCIKKYQLSDRVYQYAEQNKESFSFDYEGAAYHDKKTSNYFGYQGEEIKAGYRNDNPADTLSVGCEELSGWQTKNRVSVVILRIPADDLVTGTDIILDSDCQYLEIFPPGGTEPKYDVIVESAKVRFSSVGRIYTSAMGTFEMNVSFTTPDGEVHKSKLENGKFYANILRGEYR